MSWHGAQTASPEFIAPWSPPVLTKAATKSTLSIIDAVLCIEIRVATATIRTSHLVCVRARGIWLTSTPLRTSVCRYSAKWATQPRHRSHGASSISLHYLKRQVYLPTPGCALPPASASSYTRLPQIARNRHSTLAYQQCTSLRIVSEKKEKCKVSLKMYKPLLLC